MSAASDKKISFLDDRRRMLFGDRWIYIKSETSNPAVDGPSRRVSGSTIMRHTQRTLSGAGCAPRLFCIWAEAEIFSTDVSRNHSQKETCDADQHSMGKGWAKDHQTMSWVKPEFKQAIKFTHSISCNESGCDLHVFSKSILFTLVWCKQYSGCPSTCQPKNQRQPFQRVLQNPYNT